MGYSNYSYSQHHLCGGIKENSGQNSGHYVASLAMSFAIVRAFPSPEKDFLLKHIEDQAPTGAAFLWRLPSALFEF